MRTQKKTLLFLLLFWTAAQTFGQITTVRRYTPEATKPQQYTTPAATTTSKGSAAPTYESPEDQASRRAAALSRVQGASAKSTPTSTMTAKGVRPAEYSTGGTAPATYATLPATTMTVNGLDVHRNVRKGVGQVGNDLFTPVAELHFVQFAVYCKDTPVDKAPSIDGLMLLWHSGSKCPGGQPGASYIVKGYNTPEDAKNAVLQFKANRIDCWYNPSLTGAEVEVIGVR